MRRLFAVFLAVCLFLSGCVIKNGPKKFEKSYFLAFNTYTTITGYAVSQEAWDVVADELYDQLLEYHQLFDIYNDYPGIANLKTVNDNAGIAPVQVDQRIIALLLDCKTYYEASGGLVNAAMGSVLFSAPLIKKVYVPKYIFPLISYKSTRTCIRFSDNDFATFIISSYEYGFNISLVELG